MLFQTYWLLSLLFAASATASAALQPRQNGTISPTATAAASTASALPASPAIYLVVTDRGTPFDGRYLTVGQAFPEDDLKFILFGDVLPDPSGASVFTVDDDNGTMTHLMSGLVATYIDAAGPIIMADPRDIYDVGLNLANCEIGGLWDCATTGAEATITYGSASVLVAGGYTTPHVLVGPYVAPEEGAVEIIVLPIPL